jgi:hypothetical protein
MSNSYIIAPICLITFQIIFVIVIFWLASVLLRRSWKTWSTKYPLLSEFTGKWLDGQSMTVGKQELKLQGCVSIGLNQDYLYLKVKPMFFYSLEPIQIPRSDIQSIKETKILWARYCTFVIANMPELMFYRSAAFNKYFDSSNKQSQVIQDFTRGQDTFPDTSSDRWD